MFLHSRPRLWISAGCDRPCDAPHPEKTTTAFQQPICHCGGVPSVASCGLSKSRGSRTNKCGVKGDRSLLYRDTVVMAKEGVLSRARSCAGLLRRITACEQHNVYLVLDTINAAMSPSATNRDVLGLTGSAERDYSRSTVSGRQQWNFKGLHCEEHRTTDTLLPLHQLAS